MTYARLVSFNSVMNSFPVGGMTMRIACGTITRRRMRGRVIPSARPASSWPGSTESRPARMISDMYAASFNDSAMNAARNGLNQSLANVLQICGRPFQMNNSCKSVGVARKIQL